MKDIAYKISHGAKVLTSDARNLAGAYLRLIDENEAMKREIERLSGGEIIDLRHDELRGKTLRVSGHVTAEGMHSASNKEVNAINDLLINTIFGHTPYVTGNSFRGSRNHLERFFELNKNIKNAIQFAYDEGFQDGQALLVGLAKGTMSITDYNEQIQKVNER